MQSFSRTPGYHTLVDMLCTRARENPDFPCYSFLTDGENADPPVTYAQLDQQARRIAAWLQQRCTPGERALMVFPCNFDFISTYFGCLYAGVTPVPVYPPRDAASLAALDRITADCQPSLVLSMSWLYNAVQPFLEYIPHMKGLTCLTTDQVPQEIEVNAWVEPAISGSTIAALMYTSGSTRAPTGVMLSHDNILESLRSTATRHEFKPDDRMLLWLPFYHVTGLIGAILEPMYCDVSSIYLPPEIFSEDPMGWIRAMSRFQATISGGPNFAYELCAAQCTAKDLAGLDLSPWRLAIFGAETIRLETMERFRAVFESSGFQVKSFYGTFGLTEGTWGTCGSFLDLNIHTISIERAASTENCMVEVTSHGPNALHLVSSGEVMVNQRVEVVDPIQLTPCQADQIGEIWIGGPCVAQGYWNKPVETREIFQAHLRGNEEVPFLRTGDLGFIKNGQVYITGRLKDMVIVRGRNYYPADLEGLVERCHPALRPSACTAFSIPVEGEERLVVVVEHKPGMENLNIQEIARAVRAVIAQELHLPVHAVIVVNPESIPRTGLGKLVRFKCRDDFLSGKLENLGISYLEIDREATTPAESVLFTPRTPLEDEVSHIFKEVLQIEQVRIDDNFFALGGNSLLATQAASRASLRFQVELPPQILFEFPSVAEFAEHIQNLLGDEDAHLAPPIQPADRSQPLVLSFSQERMWFIHQLQPNSAAYNVPNAIAFQQSVNLTTLKEALNLMIQRHEILRTSFRYDGRQPVQVVLPSLEVDLPVVELTSQEELLQRINQDSEKPFDLEQAPLLRACVFSLPDGGRVLFINMHHSIIDAWAMGVFFNEFYTLYMAIAAGGTPTLPPPAIQYVDFAQWQRKWLTGQVLENELSYWRQQLTGLPLLDMPTDFPRPANQTYHGKQISVQPSPELYAAVQHLSQENSASSFMAYLAAFYALLYQYSGKDDISIGVPIANRKWVAVESLIGTLVNSLVLRTHLEGDPDCRELIARVRSTALGAYAHQEMPFEALVAELQPERDTSHSPFFQVMFNMINVPVPVIDDAAIKEVIVDIDRGGAQFDLTLTVVDTSFTRDVILNYNTDLFSPETIQRMLKQYMHLLEIFTASPDCRLSQLPTLMEEEKKRLLVEWNNTRADYPLDSNPARLFEAQVEKTPQALAVFDDHKQYTFAELNQQANRIAGYLHDFGVGPEVRVGVCLERSADVIPVLLGILKAGGAYVPLDPNFPTDRLAFMLEDSAAPLLLTRKDLVKDIPARNTRLIDIEEVAPEIDRYSPENVSLLLNGDRLLYVMYTSGSTGRPKGVMGIQCAAINRLFWMWEKYPFQAGEVCCLNSTLSFVDTIWEIYGPLLAGVPLCVMDDATVKDPQLLAESLAKNHISRIVLVPGVIKILLETFPDLHTRLPKLKWVTNSGEELKTDLARQFHTLMPDCILLNLYGSTETAADATCYESRTFQKQASIPIGRPIANSQVYILNAHLQPVAVGVPGEIYVGGDCLARGYLNRPELNAERFIPDPFSKRKGDRLYRIGDLGRYRPDGIIDYLGRSDQQVKIRGIRIELGEIEQTLKLNPAVLEAVVITRPDAAGDPQLVAYVVPPPGQEPEHAALRALLKDKLPAYMMPAHFVTLERLPLTPNGKTDKRALPAPGSTPDGTGEYVVPSTDIETELVNIWERLLGIKPIGVTDNFFDLGGHSFLAVRLFSEINQKFCKYLPLNTIFEEPTIHRLAEEIDRQQEQEAWSSLVPIQPKGSKPPIFFVHPYDGDIVGFNQWTRHLGPDQPLYGLRARGLDGVQEPLSSIEDMAALYLHEIRRVEPHGPYYIGGYCIGGVIAFELAQQIQRQGEKVALLALVNEPPTNTDYFHVRLNATFLRGFLSNLPYWFEDTRRLPSTEVATRFKIAMRSIFYNLGLEMKRLLGRGKKTSLTLEEEAMQIKLATLPEYQRDFMAIYYRKFNHALMDYTPQSYPGRLTLFRTYRQSFWCSFEPTLGWGNVAGGGLDIITLHGSNTTLTHDPDAQFFARYLQERLETAQSL